MLVGSIWQWLNKRSCSQMNYNTMQKSSSFTARSVLIGQRRTTNTSTTTLNLVWDVQPVLNSHVACCSSGLVLHKARLSCWQLACVLMVSVLNFPMTLLGLSSRLPACSGAATTHVTLTHRPFPYLLLSAGTSSSWNSGSVCQDSAALPHLVGLLLTYSTVSHLLYRRPR